MSAAILLTSGDYRDEELDDYCICRHQTSSLFSSIEERLNSMNNEDCDSRSTSSLDDEYHMVRARRKSSVTLPDDVIDCDRLPVSERPPSSASSDDSGIGGVAGSGYPIDVSSDEDPTGYSDEGCCTCSTISSSVGDAGWDSMVPPTTTRAVRQREFVSVLRPLLKNSFRSDMVFFVDLTGRTDVTFTIEPFHSLPVNAPPANNVESETVSMVTDSVVINNANCVNDANVEDVVQPSSTDFVQSPGSAEKSVDSKSTGSKSAAATEKQNHQQKMPFRVAFVRPWTLSAMVTSLVPAYLIVPPPLNYFVLKPINGPAPIPGEYYIPQNRASAKTGGVVKIAPAVIKPIRYKSDDVKWATWAPYGRWSSPVKERRWITIDKSVARGPTAGIRVLTYNVLAKNLATAERFYYCPAWILSWEHRKTLLLSEITSKNAEIIALQEVELREYITFFQPKLAQHGYTGVFALKSRARTKSSDEQLDVDGCAIFYKSNKFHAVSSHVIEFNNLALRAAVGGEDGDCLDFLHRVLSKDNVGLAVLLQTKPEAWSHNDGSSDKPVATISEPILVATAHLFWDPEYPDVKLIQTMLLTHELQRIAAATPPHLMTSRPPPLILVGDFNALPDSGVVSFLQDGKIASDHADFCSRDYLSCLRMLDVSSSGSSSCNKGKDDVETAADSVVVYGHSLGLKAVDTRAEFTNYTSWFRGVIDHIFYSTESNIRVARVLQGLPSAWLRENRVVGLPTANIPSDHVPLVVDFRLTQR